VAEGRRPLQGSVPADEGPAVARHRADRLAGVGEGHAPRELLVVGVPGQHGAGGIALGHHVRPQPGPRRPEDPLVVGEHAQSAWPVRDVGQGEERELDRVPGVHEDGKRALDAAGDVPEPGDARGVPDHVATSVRIATHRTRRGRPRVAGVVVADVHRLRGGIGHGIVRERREAVLAAVRRPGEGRARSGDDGSEIRVGDDVGPRHRGLPVAVEDDRVVAAVRREASRPVGEHDFGQRGFPWRVVLARRRRGGRFEHRQLHRRLVFGMRPIELLRQLAPIAAQDAPRHAREQDALRLAHAVAAQQERAPVAVLPGPPRAVVEEGGELRVHLVHVADWMLVQDHDVRAQALEPPVLLRLQDLAHQRQVAVLHDPHEQDREVAGDAVPPQPFLAEGVAGQDLGARAQRPFGVEHAGGQALEEQRFLAGDAEVAQAALRMRKGEGKGARGGARVVVALREGHRRLP
jgi:hypothetical protein